MAISRDIYDIEKISSGRCDIRKICERYEATMYLVCGDKTDLCRSSPGKAI